MGFFEAVQTCFTKYVDFNGRARRSEYWWFQLFGLIVSVFARLSPIVGGMVTLILLLPNMAVAIRRLHDKNRSAWFFLLPWPSGLIMAVLLLTSYAHRLAMLGLLAAIFGLLTLGCALILVVWFCQRGTVGPNRFGPDPFASDPLTAIAS